MSRKSSESRVQHVLSAGVNRVEAMVKMLQLVERCGVCGADGIERQRLVVGAYFSD